MRKPRSGLRSARGLLLMAVIGAVFLPVSGCLTRNAGPTLPYVKPAQSVPVADPMSLRVSSRVEEMEAEIQQLRGSIERLEAAGGNEQAIRNLQDRVALIERQLGIEASRAPSSAPSAQPGDQPGGVIQQKAEVRPAGRSAPSATDQSHAPVEIQNDPVAPDEKTYRDAYSLFKSGAYDQAASQFEDLLKQYPQSQLAADAIYWIGEARFSQGRFDEAVLQFDRVIKEFPGSKKELSAFLKQGQAFERMGDAKSARFIYQRLVGEHPHTAQGRLAAGRMKSLPSH